MKEIHKITKQYDCQLGKIGKTNIISYHFFGVIIRHSLLKQMQSKYVNFR